MREGTPIDVVLRLVDKREMKEAIVPSVCLLFPWPFFFYVARRAGVSWLRIACTTLGCGACGLALVVFCAGMVPVIIASYNVSLADIGVSVDGAVAACTCIFFAGSCFAGVFCLCAPNVTTKRPASPLLGQGDTADHGEPPSELTVSTETKRERPEFTARSFLKCFVIGLLGGVVVIGGLLVYVTHMDPQRHRQLGGVFSFAFPIAFLMIFAWAIRKANRSR